MSIAAAASSTKPAVVFAIVDSVAALAFGRPGIRGESSDQSRLILLLDRSASMQATDLEDGASRFEKRNS